MIEIVNKKHMPINAKRISREIINTERKFKAEGHMPFCSFSDSNDYFLIAGGPNTPRCKS